MATVNEIQTTDGYRRITVDRNEVKIFSVTPSEEAGNEKVDSTFKENYQIVSQVDISEDKKMVECLGKGETTIFSISWCKKVCQVPAASSIRYYFVCDEVFVKVTDEGKDYIYDEVGNLIAVDGYNRLSVVFGGCGVLIKKTDPRSGKESFFNIEGHLV